jgi:hypothetical protein
MGQGCCRLLFFAAMAVGVVALAYTGTAGATTSCASRVLSDWSDGRIDNTYSVACYRQALAKLPEDVRVYSTAQTDITRALQARLAAAAATNSDHGGGGGGGGGVSPVLVVAITAAILAAAGSLAAAIR